jgi:DNA-binding response OmpR family regulator
MDAPCLLVIEDAADLAQIIRKEFQSAGFEVTLCADGLSGLAEFNRRAPDCVVLDWMLPGLDGLEVLRRIRQTSAVPVLMLTARSDEVDRVVGLEVGADDYLTKPFGLRELVARVRALLRRAERIHEMMAADREQPQQILRLGCLELDPLAYTACMNGAPIDLTRTEFDLLYLFLRNPKRTFSRSYLFETVWQQTYVEGDRSVDNAILRLRKKLGSLGDEIETVWGVGYRMKRV